MTPIFRSDAGLTLPTPPGALARLAGPGGVLLREEPGEFVVPGERGVARGSAREGVREILVYDNGVALEGFSVTVAATTARGGAGAGASAGASAERGVSDETRRPTPAPPPRATISPGLVARTLPEGGVIETTFVPRALPGAVIQWASEEPEESVPRDLVLRWDVPASSVEVRYLQRGPFLRVSDGEGQDRLFLVTGDSLASWTIREPAAGAATACESGEAMNAARLSVGVRAQLPAGGALHLVALAGTDAALRDGLAMLPHLAGHERRRHGEAREGREDHLTLSGPTGVANVAEAFDWARIDLEAAWLRPSGGRGAGGVGAGGGGAGGAGGAGRVVRTLDDATGRFPAMTGPAAREATVAALATGHFALAGQLLSQLAGDAEHGRFAAAYLRAAAEHALWTGDLQRLSGERPLLGRCVMRFEASGAPADPRDARALAALLQLLADAVEPLGDRTWTAELRALAGRMAAEASGPGEPGSPDADGPKGITLPVLGGASRRAPRPGAPAPPLHLHMEWPGRREFAAGDADGGLAAWLAHIEEPADGPPKGGVHATHTILPFVLGVLGARPDANYGRLLLAPFPPSAWTAFDATGLRVGDATIDLRYRKSGETHTFTLAQTSGRAPINLVFEPAVVPLGQEVQVRLAHEIAEVGTFERGNRLGVRLQLPLDHERRVTIHEGNVATR